MISDEQIIAGCIEGRRKAYSLLYRKFASTMLGVCMRYCNNKSEAEDVLQEGFIKVFSHISSFRKEGSFEGWIKRIMINAAIDNYQHNLKHYFHADVDEIDEFTIIGDAESHDPDLPQDIEIPKEKLMELIQQLPEGYRMVFNLYAIEGLGHKEIAAMLSISENTSKTQLMKARRNLRRMLDIILKPENVKKALP